jgi:hypothetical protein
MNSDQYDVWDGLSHPLPVLTPRIKKNPPEAMADVGNESRGMGLLDASPLELQVLYNL